MNVMEETLRKKIDPFLTLDNFSILAARSLGTSVCAKSAEVLTGGCWNRVVAVSFESDASDLVFKISAHRCAPEIEREYTVLDYFSRYTNMPVPKPLLVDTTCEVIPGTLLVMEKMPGRIMHSYFVFLDDESKHHLSSHITRHVIDLHDKTSNGFGGVELEESERTLSWPDFWIPRFQSVLQESKAEGILSNRFLSRVERVSEIFSSMLEVGPGSTLTHYDIWSGNVMVANSGSSVQVTGFIDVSGYWADYARELSFMEMFGLADDRFYAAYNERHPLDDGFPLRKSIYNLKMHMKHVSMYPNERYYRVGSESCLRFIEQQASHWV